MVSRDWTSREIKDALKGAVTLRDFNEVLTRFLWHHRTLGWGEMELANMRAALTIQWRKAHRRGTPGRKEPPKMDKATRELFKKGAKDDPRHSD